MGTMNNSNRWGRFTSSNVYKLIPFGTREMSDNEKKEHKVKYPKSQKKTMDCDKLFASIGLTYIEEKSIERKMKSWLDGGAHTQALAWGNFMELVSIAIDCDGDSILVKANPRGPVCHTGSDTCFDEVNASKTGFIDQLRAIIKDRKNNPTDKSYTASLFAKGINKVAISR